MNATQEIQDIHRHTVSSESCMLTTLPSATRASRKPETPQQS